MFKIWIIIIWCLGNKFERNQRDLIIGLKLVWIFIKATIKYKDIEKSALFISTKEE